jgi:hypothetical protein
MNIFVLDLNPIKAAQYQCNKHVVKMIVESAQLLCLAYPSGTAPYKGKGHYNHPCAKWVRQSRDNFNWLVVHALALCGEYSLRYNKIHKCEGVILWCRDNQNQLDLPEIGLTPHCLAMPDDCKLNDIVAAYRKYYKNYKAYFAKWPENRQPEWW